MKIVELRAEAFKRLRAVTIRPNGSAVVIGGRNGAGKSSALDAIWAALAGAKAIPPEPIRRGERKASVTVDLGDLVVTRRFSGKGSKLEVASKDGGTVRSPQAVLDQLVGELSFDPLAFARMKPRDQAETLRRLAGIDLAAIDQEIAEAYSLRKDANAEVRRWQAALDRLGPKESGPERETSVREVLEQLEERRQNNAEIAELQQERDRATAAAERAAGEKVEVEQAADKQVADLEEQIRRVRAAAQKRLAQLDQVIESASQTVESCSEQLQTRVHQDESELHQRLERLEEENATCRRNAERSKLADELKAAEEVAEKLDVRVDELRGERLHRIASAPYPIDGLQVTDDGVLFSGFPLEQASSAEQVRVSAAIGLALNPKLRVLLIRDGSLLDEDSMRALVEQAEKVDAQLWIEKVAPDGDGCSVLIEDGEVVER